MDVGAGDFIADDLPINCQSRKGGGGGELEVAFQLSSGAVRKVARTKAMFLLAAGTFASDPHLASHQWWLFIAYITLFCLSLLLWLVCNPKCASKLAAQQHPGKLLAAAYLLRVLTLAFQAWCGLIPLNHLGAAVAAVLQVSRAVTTRLLANC